MADENEGTSPEEQALADEWAAALAEAGDDAGQADIDALMAQGGGGAAAPAAPRMAMEEFGSAPKPGNGPVALEGPNLDVILDIPVSISMEVGSTEISIRNLLQLNQGSVVELDRLAGERLAIPAGAAPEGRPWRDRAAARRTGRWHPSVGAGCDLLRLGAGGS